MDLPSRATPPVVAGPKFSARPGRRRSASGGGCASALRVAVFVVVLAPAEASGDFTTKEELQTAVDAWIADEKTAAETHGSISGWDTSRVEDLSELFKDAPAFNSELAWDTSKVTNLKETFYNAKAFNQALDWDTSSVTKSGMSSMFHNTALESDECSKAKMWEAWNGVDAFTSEYNDWSAYSVSADC